MMTMRSTCFAFTSVGSQPQQSSKRFHFSPLTSILSKLNVLFVVLTNYVTNAQGGGSTNSLLNAYKAPLSALTSPDTFYFL